MEMENGVKTIQAAPMVRVSKKGDIEKQIWQFHGFYLVLNQSPTNTIPPNNTILPEPTIRAIREPPVLLILSLDSNGKITNQ